VPPRPRLRSLPVNATEYDDAVPDLSRALELITVPRKFRWNVPAGCFFPRPSHALRRRHRPRLCSGAGARGISRAARHHRRALHRGEPDRLCRAADRAGTAGKARPAVPGREQGRRQRPCCCARRRARSARRLHTDGDDQHDARGGAGPFQERALRSGEGFHRDRADRDFPLGHRRQRQLAGA
jgi:hypothetical protein